MKTLAKEKFAMKKHISRVLILFSLLMGLSACTRTSLVQLNYPIGSVWNVPVVEGKTNWDTAPALAQEQHAGFSLANEEADLTIYTLTEGNKKDDVQTAVRAMVEGQADGAEKPVAAVLGATSNEATTRMAALANFFNVPMIVPSASGDNLLSETNLWAFQLSASNSDYANYLINNVLDKQFVYKGYEEGFEPDFNIAILYEQNTYGETAAVSSATAALQQGYNIVLYDKFPANNPSDSRLRALVNQALDGDAHMVVMISSNPDVAVSLTEFFTELSDASVRPALVGIAAGFTSLEFMDSNQLNSTYVLRQQMHTNDCPAEIKSLYAAQNYSAINLLTSAIQIVDQDANLNLNEKKLGFNVANEKIILYREALRDTIKNIDLKLPCLGQVAFDNAGHNKFLNYDIVTADNGTQKTLSAQDFVDLIRLKIDLGSATQQ